MFRTQDVDGNLGRDYLRGADGFLCAAEKILNSTDRDSGEWLFKLENPVCFLVGHAAELILKAGLVRQPDFSKFKKTHDLVFLINQSHQKQIPLNQIFCSCVERINGNFVQHDHRYQKSFYGFPENDHDRLMKLMKENSVAAKKELHDHGLVLRQVPDLSSFINAVREQLQSTEEMLELPP